MPVIVAGGGIGRDRLCAIIQLSYSAELLGRERGERAAGDADHGPAVPEYPGDWQNIGFFVGGGHHYDAVDHHQWLDASPGGVFSIAGGRRIYV